MKVSEIDWIDLVVMSESFNYKVMITHSIHLLGKHVTELIAVGRGKRGDNPLGGGDTQEDPS